jgi:hypothetical protein
MDMTPAPCAAQAAVIWPAYAAAADRNVRLDLCNVGARARPLPVM